MNQLVDLIDTTELKTKGFQIVRSFFSEEVKQDLRARAREILELRDAGKLTTYDQDSQGLGKEWFQPLVRNKSVVDFMIQLLGPNVGVKGYRVLAKDKHFRLQVHVHQDWPYNTGDTNKIICFVPLTRMNADNGGLIFLEGSHHYGPVCMGPLDLSRFPPMPESCPDVDVGDLLICDYLTWHYSNTSISGAERLMLQLNYQPADDPSSNDLVAGVRSHDKLLLNRLDASSRPSVELNGQVARKAYESGDLDRATRFAHGLVWDDPDHSSAALLLSEILTAANDPTALKYLEMARASIRKQAASIAALDRRYGLDEGSLFESSKSSAGSAQAPSRWRPLDVYWNSQIEGVPGADQLPTTFSTPDQPWGYGAVSDVIEIGGLSTIKIKARAEKGKVGFCLIGAHDGAVASDQHVIKPEAGDSTVMITATAERSSVKIVVRNFGDPDVAGEVVLHSADILEHVLA